MSTLTTYDFYFSQNEKDKLIEREKFFWYSKEKRYRPAYFKGQEYTEMVRSGERPITSYNDDLVYIGTGKEYDISFEPPTREQILPLHPTKILNTEVTEEVIMKLHEIGINIKFNNLFNSWDFDSYVQYEIEYCVPNLNYSYINSNNFTGLTLEQAGIFIKQLDICRRSILYLAKKE